MRTRSTQAKPAGFCAFAGAAGHHGPVRIRAAAAVIGISLALSIPATPIGATPATTAPPIPRVGAVFFPYLPGLTQLLGLPHTCTGSVVHSASRNVVLTAAHCVLSGSGAGFAFAPGYHDGVFPYGMWTVRRVYVNPAWKASHDPLHDYAFLTVAPRTVGGVSRNIEDVVGAYSLGTAPAAGTTVTVDGYLLGAHDRALTCTTSTYVVAGYPTVDCAGFGDGTSGGPWLRGDQVVGVIGGLHQGGCVDGTSNTSPFGSDVAADLARAAAGGPGDFLGLPGSSGCT